MTEQMVTRLDGGETPPPAARPSTMDDETRAALVWLLDNRRHVPARLLHPWAASILGRQVTEGLIRWLTELDLALQALAEHGAGPDVPEPREDIEALALQTDVATALDALHRLPAGPMPGDRALVDVGDLLLAEPLPLPVLVVSVGADGWLLAESKYGVTSRPVSAFRVTDRAVYVSARGGEPR